MIRAIPQRWRLLSGQNNWQNLLSPLDNDLQQYLMHYGSMAQATYDTFNANKLSKYCGSSRYSMKNLFPRVGLVQGNPFEYEAVKYIYATSNIPLPEAYIVKSLSDKAWSNDSNWMGYVAVATDKGKIALGRRDILVAWRGTILPIEWMKDLDFTLVDASKIVGGAGGGANVHQGFLSLYTSSNSKSNVNKMSARDQVLSEVKKQIERYKGDDISLTITGHSLGAALSTLNAADIVCNGYNKISNQPNKTFPVTVFNYGSPQVGDTKFKDALKSKKDLHILGVQNAIDIVPYLPPIGFSEVGVKLNVDSTNSPYLKSFEDISSTHNLEAAYLHGIAIANGDEVKRDIALVNKRSSALKDKYLIPKQWWCERNKGMVQLNDGSWILDHEKDNSEF